MKEQLFNKAVARKVKLIKKHKEVQLLYYAALERITELINAINERDEEIIKLKFYLKQYESKSKHSTI